MAERIVSPGVFTREKDLSFLPQGVAEIGAAIVGPTERGPAFTPTVITSNSEFESIFGAQGGKVPFYAGLAAKRYLDGGAPSVTVVRVLGIGGYSIKVVNIVTSGTMANTSNRGVVLATLAPSKKLTGGTQIVDSTYIFESKYFLQNQIRTNKFKIELYSQLAITSFRLFSTICCKSACSVVFS